MSNHPPDYPAYWLRLWRAEQDAQPVWRASLENPHTGERRGFASLDHLVTYLQDMIETENLSQHKREGAP